MTFTLPICIWTLNAFFRDLPLELEEAARVDGCTRLQVFTQIVAPLAAPGVFTTAILLFIAAWNEFLFARTFMVEQRQYTVPVAIAQFEGADLAAATPWGENLRRRRRRHLAVGRPRPRFSAPDHRRSDLGRDQGLKQNQVDR